MATSTSTRPPLDQKSIVRISADLSKATADPQTSPSVLSSLLQQLRSGVSASEDLLRSTKIGIIVNKLKDEKVVKDEGVRREAIELVNKWKRDIQAKKSGGASPRPGSSVGGAPSQSKPSLTNGASAESAAKSTESQSVTGAAGEKWKSLKPEQRSAEKDGVNTKVTGNGARDNCLKLLYDGLIFRSESHSPQHVLPIASAIEAAVYTKNKSDTNSDYKMKIRSLYLNLKSPNSPHLRNALLASPQTVTPEKLVQMSPEELKSPEQVAQDEKLREQNKNNAMVGQDQKAISDILTCPQCKQKKVSYSQAQTRSADEPMTTFCECTVCGRKWKFS